MLNVSYRGALPPLTQEESELARDLRRHVAAVAGEEHNTVHPDRLERAARYVEATLFEQGYRVIRQEFNSGAVRVRNIEVAIVPAGAEKPRLIVVGAHYDSAQHAPGANDNGSGTAAVLELAKRLRGVKSGYELRLVLYTNEEPPWFQSERMGSLVHARALRAEGRDVAAMLSLETIGYYSDTPGSQRYPFPLNLLYPDTGNFIGFVSDLRSRTLVRQAVGSFRTHTAFPSQGAAAPAFVTGIDWSDHWSYWQQGWPALMVTDTALFRYRITTRRRTRRTSSITGAWHGW